MPYKRYDVYSHLAREDLINWFEPFKNNSGPYVKQIYVSVQYYK